LSNSLVTSHHTPIVRNCQALFLGKEKRPPGPRAFSPFGGTKWADHENPLVPPLWHSRFRLSNPALDELAAVSPNVPDHPEEEAECEALPYGEVRKSRLGLQDGSHPADDAGEDRPDE